jgi:hypothetical protein
MDKGMAIFGHMGCDRGGRPVLKLYPEPVCKETCAPGLFDAVMLRKEPDGEIIKYRRVIMGFRECRSKQVPVQVAVHVLSRNVIADAVDAAVQKPVGFVVDTDSMLYELPTSTVLWASQVFDSMTHPSVCDWIAEHQIIQPVCVTGGRDQLDPLVVSIIHR